MAEGETKLKKKYGLLIYLLIVCLVSTMGIVEVNGKSIANGWKTPEIDRNASAKMEFNKEKQHPEGKVPMENGLSVGKDRSLENESLVEIEQLMDYTIELSPKDTVVYGEQNPSIVVTTPEGQVVPSSEYRAFYAKVVDQANGVYEQCNEEPATVGMYGVCIEDVPGGKYEVMENFIAEEGSFFQLLDPMSVLTIEKWKVNSGSVIDVFFDGKEAEKNTVEYEGVPLDVSQIGVVVEGKVLPKSEYEMSLRDSDGRVVSVVDKPGEYTVVVKDKPSGVNDNVEIEKDAELCRVFQVVDEVKNPGTEPDGGITDGEGNDNGDNGSNGEIDGDGSSGEGDSQKPIEPVEPEVPAKLEPSKHVKITTDYGIIGVRLDKPAKNIIGYRLAVCQLGKNWRYIDLKSGHYNLYRLYKKRLTKNGLFCVKVAAISKGKIIGRYTKIFKVYANPVGTRSLSMKAAQLIKAKGYKGSIKVLAKKMPKINKTPVKYRIAWREKGKQKWHYGKLTTKRWQSIRLWKGNKGWNGLKRGKRYVVSLRCCYVSPVDGRTKIWTRYDRKVVRV